MSPPLVPAYFCLRASSLLVSISVLGSCATGLKINALRDGSLAGFAPSVELRCVRSCAQVRKVRLVKGQSASPLPRRQSRGPRLGGEGFEPVSNGLRFETLG